MMLSNTAMASGETTRTVTNIDKLNNTGTEIVQEIDNDSVTENNSSPSIDESENNSGNDISYGPTLNDSQSSENEGMEHSSAPLQTSNENTTNTENVAQNVSLQTTNNNSSSTPTNQQENNLGIDLGDIEASLEDTDSLKANPSNWYTDYSYSLEGNYIYLYEFTNSNKTSIEVDKTVTIGSKTYTVVVASGCYDRKTYLTSIKINSGVKLQNGLNLFYGCSGLTTLDVSGFDTSSCTNMENMFHGCNNITSLDVSNFNTSNVTDMGGMFNGCSGLTSLDCSNFNTSKVTDMWAMFSGCHNLTSLNISSFNTSKVTNMSSTFSGLHKLPTLTVSNLNTANVTDMMNMFNNCRLLTSLDVSNFNTAKVTKMSYMFSGCENLTTLDLSNFNTAKVTNMQLMFQNDSNLTSINMSNFNTSLVTSMHAMFIQCSSLTSLDVSMFNTAKVTNMNEMFKGCSKITSLNLTGFKTDLVTDMSDMFSYCSKLSTLTLGVNFSFKGSQSTMQDTKLNNGGYGGGWLNTSQAHFDCSSISSITYIPNNVADTYTWWIDTVAPVAGSITGGTNFKATYQNVTLTATDDFGVKSYYWGTTSPTSNSEFTSVTLTTSFSESQRISDAGTYYFAVKDAEGNMSNIQTITMVSYLTKNLLETIAGTTGVYTSDNYTTSLTKTYLIKSGTSLTLSEIYGIPTGADATTFKGYSLDYSTTPSTMITTAPSASGTTYYLWFNRIKYTATINAPIHGGITAETYTQADNSVTVPSGASSNGTLMVKYGDKVRAKATPDMGYSLSSWSGGYISGTSNTRTGGVVTDNVTIIATFADLTAPTATIEGGATLKSANQTVTLKASDALAVTAYYWGTTEPSDASSCTTTTELSDLIGNRFK